MDREERPDAASPGGPEPGRAGEAAPSPRRRAWPRRVLLAFGGVLAVLAAAAAWIALDPALIRPAAEYLATAASGRPVVIGALDFQVVEGRTRIEARKVRVGRTTTERVRITLAGMRPRVTGDGVRFPNGSSIDHFRASVVLSLTGRPRVSTVDATGARLVAARRERADPDGPPPLARLLVVPRILLRLGLERLVLRSGAFEYRGRDSTRSAGMTAVLHSTDRGLAFRGELLVGAGAPALPFDGTVRDPMTDDWRIDFRLAGADVPMEGVRLLAGVLEPGETVRAALGRISSEARFLLTVRLARARIESADLDFTFGAREQGGAPEDGAPPKIGLEGVRFLARTVPGPGGWTVTGEVDWSRLPGGEEAAPSPFTLGWSTGAQGSLRWSARRVPIPMLAQAARNALPPEHSLRAALERLRAAGTIDELAASGDPGAGGEPSFRLSAAVSGFGVEAGGWLISEGGARIEIADGDWRVRFADDHLLAAAPSFRSTPYELTLRGDVRVSAGERAWAAHTADLRFAAAAGVAGRIAGSLEVPAPEREGALSLDAEIRVDEAALADLGAMLPDRRAPRFARWYRRAVGSGRLTGAEVRVRGDPRRIPFPEGDGEFRATGAIRGLDFAYAEGWPAVRIEHAEMRAEGPGLEFSGVRGSIFDSAIEDGAARLRDTTNRTGRIQVSLAGSGPARDLLAFVRASPLRTEDGGPAPDLRAEGPASTTAELDLPYGRGAADREIGVSGTIALHGAALGLAGRRAVLEEVEGELAFDAATLAGGPLRGRFRGAEIESRVEFDRGEGLALHFSGEGDGDWFGAALEDLVDLGPEETGPWLEHLLGRASWEAEYRSRDGGGIVFRSDLRAAAVDLPPPFEKPAGTARRLEVVLTPGETEWRIGASYGPEVNARLQIADEGGGGGWALARGALALGGASPALPAEGHVEVSGKLAELDLDRWLVLGAGRSSGPAGGWLSHIGRISLETAGARLWGRRIALSRLELAPAPDGSEFHVTLAGEGLAGDITFPADPASGEARARLDRVRFDEPFTAAEEGGRDPPDDEPGDGLRPDRWPSFDLGIASLRFENLDLGAVRAVGTRTGRGIEIEDVAVASSSLRMRGSGSWRLDEDGAPVSRFTAKLNSEDVSRLLASANLDEEAMAGGVVEVRFDLAWPGSPLEPSLAQAEGAIEMDAEDGNLPRVPVGPLGRLFGLFSLEALPRVLALDLRRLVGKGFAYDRITARTRIEDGSARIRELVITGPSARIEVRGGVDLVARRYDQEIQVTPRLSRSGALFPVWAAIWPYLVANFIIQEITADKVTVDRLFSLRYRLHGPLDDPQVERIEARTPAPQK